MTSDNYTDKLFSLIGKDKELTLRASGLWKVVSGEILTVMPKKHWSFAGHPYLSADITGSRFDLAVLDLTPLKLTEFGMWDPAQHYWGEDDEPEEGWEKEIKAAGSRPEYEMEKIVPGEDPDDFDSDPILEAVELKDAGEGQWQTLVISGRRGRPAEATSTCGMWRRWRRERFAPPSAASSSRRCA